MLVRSLVGLFIVCSMPSAANAQSPGASAEAEQLFRDGKSLMAAGDYAQACEAFAGSMRQEPLPTTAVNLADCREKNQQYASAWGAFLEAARLARSRPELDALRALAESRAKTLEPRLSRLTIVVSDDRAVPGLVITRNGVPIEAAAWNRAMPVDGDTYLVEGNAPSFEPWSARVKVGAAQDAQTLAMPALVQLTIATAAPTKARPARLTGTRKAALGLGAGGLLGLGAGLVLELKSRGTYDDAKTAATADERHNLTDEANQQRLFGTIAAGAGIALIGAGVYLWVKGKPGASDHLALRPTIAPNGVTASLTGRF